MRACAWFQPVRYEACPTGFPSSTDLLLVSWKTHLGFQIVHKRPLIRGELGLYLLTREHVRHSQLRTATTTRVRWALFLAAATCECAVDEAP
eukprot:366490-Chlamydomonas_euryale.AAC.2